MANYQFQKIFAEGAQLGYWGDKYNNSTRLGLAGTRYNFNGKQGELIEVRAISFYVTRANADTDINTRELVREVGTIEDLLDVKTYDVIILGMKAFVKKIGKVDIGGVDFFFRADWTLKIQRSANWPI